MSNANQFKKSNKDRRYFYNKMPNFRLFLATNSNNGLRDPKTIITSYIRDLHFIRDFIGKKVGLWCGVFLTTEQYKSITGVSYGWRHFNGSCVPIEKDAIVAHYEFQLQPNGTIRHRPSSWWVSYIKNRRTYKKWNTISLNRLHSRYNSNRNINLLLNKSIKDKDKDVNSAKASAIASKVALSAVEYLMLKFPKKKNDDYFDDKLIAERDLSDYIRLCVYKLNKKDLINNNYWGNYYFNFRRHQFLLNRDFKK